MSYMNLWYYGYSSHKDHAILFIAFWTPGCIQSNSATDIEIISYNLLNVYNKKVKLQDVTYFSCTLGAPFEAYSFAHKNLPQKKKK